MTSPSSLSNCHGPWYHAQLSPVAGSLWHSVEASRRASAAVEAIGSSTGGRVTRSSTPGSSRRLADEILELARVVSRELVEVSEVEPESVGQVREDVGAEGP